MLRLRLAAPITVTPTALAQVARLLAAEEQAGLALRVAVRPGGCSGFSYEMYFDTDLNDDDLVSELETDLDGNVVPVRVAVDPQSAALLDGATLDFNDGLQGSGFKVENPKASRTCGCGQSFS